MASHDNAAFAQNLYQLFNRGELDRAVALAGDGVEVELVPFGQTFHGPQGFMDFMAGFKRAFPDLTVTIVNQVATDDQVVNECTWRGTNSGPLVSPAGEIPPTGRTVEGGRFCEVWSIEDGKLTSLRNYQDVSTWLRQLGLAP